MMKDGEHSYAEEFLELASEQRLAILLKLSGQNSKIATLAKEFGVTVPEVYRNFERLLKAELITKGPDGDYSITAYGKIVCNQIPSLQFLYENKKYFRDHAFGDIPTKFLQQIGALEGGKQITGFVKIMEQWKEMYKNAGEFICNILYEVPYSSDLIDPLVKKLENGVKLRTILSETAIMPNERKGLFDKLGFKKFCENGALERKMKPDVSVVIVLNEIEGLIMFPNKSGDVELSEGFCGSGELFQEWCQDYFNYCWENAKQFHEGKLKKNLS
jgi:predicted transcriptional regulator